MSTDYIYERRSIRHFLDKPVSREIIEQILDAGRVAPSAKNRQPWKYIVFGGEDKDELMTCMEKGVLREEHQPLTSPLLLSAKHHRCFSNAKILLTFISVPYIGIQ